MLDAALYQHGTWVYAERRVALAVRAAQSTEDLKDKAVQLGQEAKVKAGETDEVFKSNVAQLLGVRGGEQTADKWKIRLQLTKPVTWVPLIWGAHSQFSLCNAISSHD